MRPPPAALSRALLLAAAVLLGCAATAPPALARPAPPLEGAPPTAAAALAPPAPPGEASAITGAVGAPARAGARPGPGRWRWPLTPAPAVVHRFRAPPTPWSPGHRGVDLRAGVGAPVLAAGDGRIGFAGQVAGRGVVTVVHAGGLRTTYEPVAASVAVSAVVRAGQRIGVLTGQPGHCPPGACLHWGLRRGELYLDPLTLLGATDPPVLKPLWR